MLRVGLSAVERSVLKLPVPTFRYQCIGTSGLCYSFRGQSGRRRRKGYVALTTGLLIIALILYAEIFAFK